MSKLALRALATSALVVMASAPALAGTATGTFNGQTWTAENTIVGIAPTGDVNGGGDARYFANQPRYSGVVTLIMTYATGSFICTGSLLPDRVSVLTAGHCVSDGAGTANPLVTTAYFNPHNNPNSREFQDPASTAITVSQYIVNEGYTGEVIDQNDIAIVRLSQAAPEWAVSYAIYDGGDLTGTRFNVAGFGGRSTGGGNVGQNSRTGYLRQGDNTYSYRWGADEFGGFFTDRDGSGENFFGTAEVEYSYVSDFDNGTAARDTGCRIAAAVGAPAGFGCEQGVGAMEVGVAGGDSGGPQFVNGRLASVTSYGLSFGTAFGDSDALLNSSFGEFSGYVPTFIHYDWIANNAAVPEPQSWAMMLMGFGLLGAGMRSRTRKTVLA